LVKMALEDIPKMQLWVPNEKPKSLELSIRQLSSEEIIRRGYSSKFLVVKPVESPAEKGSLFAFSGNSTHGQVFDKFLEVARREYELGRNEFFYFPSGGGLINIRNNVVRISGDSYQFGKYDPQIVVPIVERFIRDNLTGFNLEAS